MQIGLVFGAKSVKIRAFMSFDPDVALLGSSFFRHTCKNVAKYRYKDIYCSVACNGRDKQAKLGSNLDDRHKWDGVT